MNVEQIKKDALKEVNDYNERQVTNKIKDIIRNIGSSQKYVNQYQEQIKNLQKDLREIELPKEVTAEILG